MSFEADLKRHYTEVHSRLSPRTFHKVPVPPPRRSSVITELPPVKKHPIPRTLRIERILMDVALEHLLKVSDLSSDSMQQRIVLARNHAAYRLRREISVKGNPLTYQRIGDILHIHHATVMYGIASHTKTIAGL